MSVGNAFLSGIFSMEKSHSETLVSLQKSTSQICCEIPHGKINPQLLFANYIDLITSLVVVEKKKKNNIPIPLAATSVATMIGDLPVLNSFRTQSRSL